MSENPTSPHENNMQETIDQTREDLAGVIVHSEKNKELPPEALILSNTETVVFFGNKLERTRFKKKWLHMMAEKLAGEPRYQLQKFGKTVVITPAPEENSEVWHFYETADVHMTPQARQRLEENASAEALRKDADIRIQAAAEEGDG